MRHFFWMAVFAAFEGRFRLQSKLVGGRSLVSSCQRQTPEKLPWSAEYRFIR